MMKSHPTLSVRGLALKTAATLDFETRAGDVLAVIGDNGTGKSLLLSILSGLLRPVSGSVRVFGSDLFNPRERKAAQSEMGVVLQHSGLLRSLTVFENVALPFLARGLAIAGALEERVMLRLRLVGCAHLAHEEVRRLSEGDRRCIALVRALAGRNRLLIADEPAASLAPAKKALVEELLASLIRTGALSSIVLATQDLEFAQRLATHFLVLHADGTSTFLRNDEVAENDRFMAFARRAA